MEDRAGAAAIILPIESACYRIFAAEHYANLACTLRRGEEADPETLVEQLASVGYQPVDMVEMRGQYALRGGILDIYPPEMDAPLRIEFLGDEIESMRKFDPETQRSSAPVDEAILLPLTETPMTNALLSRVHTRLSGRRLDGENMPARSDQRGGYAYFSGLGVFCGRGLRPAPDSLRPASQTRIFVEEPGMVQNQLERWWNKVEQRHERSGIDTLFHARGFISFAMGVADACRRRAGVRPGSTGSGRHPRH